MAMKYLLFLSLAGLLISCKDDNDLIIELDEISLSSVIVELPDGSVEYEVFEVEHGNFRVVNTGTNPLRSHSFGLLTSLDYQGNPTGVGLASFTEDLQFIDLNSFRYEEVFSFPDSLQRVRSLIIVETNDVIGIISESRLLKIRIKDASYGMDSTNTPQSHIIFQGEYL